MRKFLIKILGLAQYVSDFKNKITELENETESLKKTIDAVSIRSTDAFNRSVRAIYLNLSLPSRDGDNFEYVYSSDRYAVCRFDGATSVIEDIIRKEGRTKFMEKHGKLKERIVFTDKCIECMTPINKGCGSCLECRHSNHRDMRHYYKDLSLYDTNHDSTVNEDDIRAPSDTGYF